MGVKLLLDTNAIIALLKENEKIKKATDTADAIFISIISELEFKSFKNISKSDLRLFDSFTSMIDVVDLEATNNILKKKIIEIRNTYRLKLPDAIIAATAIVNNATLITADTDFRKVKDLEILSIQ
ncbi:MAG: type II toxin-antitoxin system VapC family toxin [Ginsengibacter sp.]